MYYQIISNHEIQVLVVGHVLKKCGLYANDCQDETHHSQYAFNHWFEDYYRPYLSGNNEIILDESTENELRSFIINGNWDNKVSCNVSDRLISKYIGKYMKTGTLIVVDYSIEDLNDDLINELSADEYTECENLKQSFVDNCKNWNVIRIDYKKFTDDKNYFKNIIQSLGLDSSVDIETIHPHYYMLETSVLLNNR
jgi:hypothetical protein